MFRTKEGAWCVDPMLWNQHKNVWMIDYKDLYGTDNGSVEQVVNAELFQLVNATMFADDDGVGEKVP